jgi:hypothetical protein
MLVIVFYFRHGTGVPLGFTGINTTNTYKIDRTWRI